MARNRIQFQLWHILVAVLLCAVLFGSVQSIDRGKITNSLVVIWIVIGAVVGHCAAILVLDYGRLSSAALATSIAVVGWFAAISATAATMFSVTRDIVFAMWSGLVLGTPLFFAVFLVFALVKPYFDALQADNLAEDQIDDRSRHEVG